MREPRPDSGTLGSRKKVREEKKRPETAMLLTSAAEANLLPDNTSVRLLWAWQMVILPDGYIPATVQEPLLHVFMGETAASALLITPARSHGNASREGRPPNPCPCLDIQWSACQRGPGATSST